MLQLKSESKFDDSYQKIEDFFVQEAIFFRIFFKVSFTF
jgi:hypothetical protein